jgi:hypothetical protein
VRSTPHIRSLCEVENIMKFYGQNHSFHRFLNGCTGSGCWYTLHTKFTIPAFQSLYFHDILNICHNSKQISTNHIPILQGMPGHQIYSYSMIIYSPYFFRIYLSDSSCIIWSSWYDVHCVLSILQSVFWTKYLLFERCWYIMTYNFCMIAYVAYSVPDLGFLWTDLSL